ncbi:MAG TPA: DUF488 family protein [Propionibacteriaceae bacterium]|nr:DUF488 family protein [Propionibacteriaceae bacterium]
MNAINLSRVYDHEQPVGQAFLVERLWPRGIRKNELHMEAWLRDVAPSAELRTWFSHDPERWSDFRRRYVAELDANRTAWAPLIEAAARGPVTLLFSSRDEEHNNAVVLRDYLLSRLEHPDDR